MSPEHRPGRRGSSRTRQALRDLHNQTWELELLISGTVAIVLAFLPSRVDEFYFSATAQTVGTVDQIAFLVFYFAKLTLYTLIFAFGVHIVVRAFWVAMVGLDSVFPRGPRWKALNLGPFGERVYRRDMPSVRELVVASDAIASVTFAAAFTLVATFTVSIPWAVAFGAVSAIAVRLLGLGISVGAALVGGAMFAGLLLVIPVMIDRARGASIEERGGGRLLERALAFTARVSGLRVYGPIQYTLASNLGSRTFGVGIFGFMAVVVSFFLVRDGFLTGGALSFAADAFDPPRAGAWEVDRTLYEEDFEKGRRRMLTPSIPAPVLDPETGWLRVFAPILPGSDPEAMARVCPEVEPLGSAGVALLRRANRAPSVDARPDVEAVVRCRGSLWEVRIDGELTDVAPRLFTRDDGVRGLAWMVDTRAIPAGAHLVEIARAPAAVDSEEAQDAGDLPRRYEIPFWN